MKMITNETIQSFKKHLTDEEKSHATIEKYVRDVTEFALNVGDRELTKAEVLEYKKHLCEKYAPRSVNSILSSLNALFAYNEWHDLRVRTIKMQRKLFTNTEKNLSKNDYERLLTIAQSKRNKRIFYLIQTLCSTGIRVSELRFITVDAVDTGIANINSKGKLRQVFLPKALCGVLKQYIKEQKITSGAVFVSRTGKPLDRSYIWKSIKKLCESAGIEREKAFPHNLRHLFARTYYSQQKDVVRLADLLGHSSIETTRIYTMEAV